MANPPIPNTNSQKQEKKGFALFKKRKDSEIGPSIPDILERTTTIDRRLRILEGRYNDLNRKTQLTDKSLLNERKRFTQETRTIDSDILELKREVNEIKNKLGIVINELTSCVRKDDLEALKKYIDLWDPMKFITRDQAEKIIKEIIKETAK